MSDTVEQSRYAWNVIRRESQPDYDLLTDSYRDNLNAHCEAVNRDHRVVDDGGSVFQRFEEIVLEQLLPERYHPDNSDDGVAASEVETPEPEEVVKTVKKPAKKAAPKPKPAPKAKPKVIKKGAKKR